MILKTSAGLGHHNRLHIPCRYPAIREIALVSNNSALFIQKYVDEKPLEICHDIQCDEIWISRLDDSQITHVTLESDGIKQVYNRDKYDTCVFRRDVIRASSGRQNADYEAYKQRAISDTIILVGGMSGTACVAGWSQEGIAFLIGGGLGLTYLIQLCAHVDRIEDPQNKVIGVARFATIALAIGMLQHEYADLIRDKPSILVCALFGFMVFRSVLIIGK